MGVLLRGAAIFAGSYLTVLGLSRLWWEFWSWGVLAWLGERPALVGRNPRIHIQGPIVIASAGILLLLLGLRDWL